MDAAKSEFAAALGYGFREPALLGRALTHASAPREGGKSNERLEYLGDAVVGLVVCDHLFRTFPSWTEGQMTEVKSAVVSRRMMAPVGRRMGIPEVLEVDDGLRRRSNYTIAMVSGAYEAVTGAIYLDGGFQAARDFVVRTLGPAIDRVLANEHARDCKSILQRRTQAERKGIPTYRITRLEGPDHLPCFEAVVEVEEQECGTGRGATKRAAEQHAAGEALNVMYPGWLDDDDGQ